MKGIGVVDPILVWMGFQKLINAGVLPTGGLGLYLKDQQGFIEASSTIHYDYRAWQHGPSSKTSRSPLSTGERQTSSRWVWLNGDFGGGSIKSTDLKFGSAATAAAATLALGEIGIKRATDTGIRVINCAGDQKSNGGLRLNPEKLIKASFTLVPDVPSNLVGLWEKTFMKI